MGVSTFSGRLLKRLRERAPQANRHRRVAPLSVRGLEKRIVLDATIAVAGGSVDISGLGTGTNVDVTREMFDINGDTVFDDVYRFSTNNDDWTDGVSNLSGQVDLNGVAGSEAFVSGKDLYVSAAFLETNAGGLSVNGAAANPSLRLETDITTVGNQDYGVRVQLQDDVTLTAPTVTFNDNINGSGNDLTVGGNVVFGNAADDTVMGVAVLHVTGTTIINTDTVSTDGTQTYDDGVTIGSPAGTAELTTSDDAILFGSTVDLNSNLTVDAGTAGVTFTGAVNGGKVLEVDSTGNTIFNGLVGGGTPLTSLTTDAGGTTQIKGGGVHTTGDQTYNDDVRLGTGTQSLSGDDIHFLEEVDGLSGGLGNLLIANTDSVTFDKAVGSINDVASFKVSAVDVTFGTGTFVEVTGASAESVHIVATGTLILPAGFTVRAAFNGLDYDGVASTFTPRPAPGVPDTALVELPAVPPTFSSTTNLDGSATTIVTLPIGNTDEKGLRLYVDWGDTSDPANRFEGPDGWADGDGLGDNTSPGDLDAIDGGSTVSLTHTYTAAEVAAQQFVDSTFDVKYAVFQHEAIVIEAARLEQVGEAPIGTAGGPLIVLTTTMLFAGPPGPRFEPPPAASSPNLVNGLVYVEIAAAPFGGGTVAVGGNSVDLSNFISGTTVTVTDGDFDINGDLMLDPVYVFELNTGTWNDGVVNLSGPIDLDGIAGAEAYVDGGFLYVSETFLETNPGGLSITGDGIDPTIILATDITTTGDQDYLAEVELQSDVVLSSGAGNITFGDTVTGSQGLTINSTGTTTFEAAVDLTSLTTDAGGQTVFAAGVGTVTTAAEQTYGDTVVLEGNLVQTATVVTLTGGLTGGTNDLTIVGDAELGDSVTDTVDDLGTFEVTGNTTIFAGSVTSTGPQTYDRDVTLGSDVELTASLVTIDGSVVGGGNDLTIDADAVFGDASTDSLTGLGLLEVTGTTLLNAGEVTSTGTQTYQGAVTLGAHVTLTSGGGNLTFTGAVNGPFDLVANSTGTTTFSGPVGDSSPLTSLTTNAGGTTHINGGSVETTGNQLYGDDVSLGQDAILTGDLVTFLGTVTGNANSLDIIGDAVFGDAATDTVTGLDTLSVSQTTTINTNTVTSTGSQTYTGAVTIGATAILATLSTTNSPVLFGSTTTLGSDLTVSTGSGTITWTGAINGPFDLVANSTGTTTFSGPVGDSSPLTSLTTNAGGTTHINGGSVETTGNQLYGDDVSLGQDAILTGDLVTFLGTVTGNANSLDIIGDAVFGDAATDTVTGLDTLSVSQTTTINTNTVTSTGSQTYTGAVTIGATAILATLSTTNSPVLFGSTTTLGSDLTVSTGSGTITWTGAINGPFDLVANSTGTTTFSGPVGDSSPLTSLTTNAGGTTHINGGSVETTGNQLYGDDVSLGQDAILTGDLVTFLGTVTGNANSLDIIGDAVFGDAATDTVTGLDTLSVSQTTTINTNTVTSTGSQTYTGAVTIGATAILATLSTTNSPVLFGSTTTLGSDLTVSTGSGTITWTGAINGPFDLVANSTGTTTFSGPVGDSSPLTSLTTNAGGTTHINGGSVETTGNQLYGDDVSLGQDAILTGDLVTFLGTVTGNANSLDIIGDAVFGDAATDTVTGLDTLSVSQTTTINTNTVTSTGSQTYTGAVTIGATAILATLSTTNSPVLFGSTTTLGSDLTVSTGSGTITWTGAINGPFDLVANSTGTTTFSGPVGDSSPLTSLTTNAGGTTHINGGSVETTGNQLYGDDVSLGQDAILTGDLVTFLGTVTGNANSLDIIGDAVFGDAATDTVTGLDTLSVSQTTTINTNTVTSTGSQTYTGAVTIGATAILATLSTTNSPVLFGSTTTLGSDLTVSTGSGTITWTGAINGPFDLVANSTGTTTFSGPVGDSSPLTSLTTNAGGTTHINGGSVETTGNQLYGDDVSLGQDAILTGDLVTFLGTVTGNANSLDIIGDAVFGDAATDTVTGLDTLSVSQTTTINTNTVTSTGSQTYTGAVTIGATAILATLSTTNSPVLFGSTTTLGSDLTVSTGSGTITWTGAINGPFDLVANSTGTTTFSGPVGDSSPLTSLTTNAGGTTHINGGSVETTGNQLYGDDVSLGQDAILTGDLVTFLGTVTGNANSLDIIGDAVFGDAATDTVTGLDTLSVSQTTTINTNTVTSTGSQTYTGAVTIGATAILATLSTTNSPVLFGSTTTLGSDLTVSTGSGTITWTGAINGPFDLVANSTGTTTFSGPVGDSSPLTSLTTNAGGTTQIKGGGVHTTGDQTYNDDVRLGTGTQSLSGDDIHFLEEVDGLSGGLGNLLIANTDSVTFDKAVGSINDVASFKVSAVDVTFGTGTFVEVTGASAESVHIVATGTLILPAGFTVRAAFNGLDYDGVASTFTPRPAPGVPDTALVELPAVPPTFSSTTNLDGSATTIVTLPIGNTDEKGLRLYVDWGDTSDPANRFEGPDGWADGDGLGDNTSPGDLDAIDGGSTVSLTHTYTAAEVAAQQFVDSTFDVKYAVFQHEAIVIEAARLEQVGEAPIGTAGGPLIVLTTTMLFAGPPGPRFEPPPAASSPNLVNGLVYVEIAAAPFGGGTVAVGGNSVDLSNFISGTTVTVTDGDFDINGDLMLDPVYVFELNTGTWNDGVVNLSGPIDLDGIAGAEAYVDGGFLYVSETFLETNPGGLSITGDGIDPTIILATDITTTGDQDYLAEVELQSDVVLSSGAGNITFGDTVTGSQGLTINSTGTTTFEAAVDLTSLTTDAGGQTVFGTGVATVTTATTQQYDDNVTLAAAATVFSSTGNEAIAFNGTLTGAATATTVTTGGLTTFGGNVNVLSLLTNGTGTTAFGTGVATVTTATTQQYDDNVTLAAAATVFSSTGNEAIAFNGTLTGAATATTVTTGGLTTFGGNVNVLSLLTNGTGTTAFGTGVATVTTATTQQYDDNVTLAAAATVFSSTGNEAIAFNGTLTGAATATTVTTGGLTTFGGNVNVLSLLTNGTGTTAFGTGVATVTTATTQQYDDNVTLAAAATVFSSTGNEAIAFNGTLTGAATATTVTTGGLTTFGGNVNVLSLLTNGTGTTAFGTGVATVTTATTQQYDDNVTLAAAATVFSSTGNEAIAFNGTLTGAATATTVTTGGLTTFGGNVNVLSLLTNGTGTTAINGGGVHTTGNQIYGDDVEVGSGTQALSGDVIHFFGGVDGRLDRLGDLDITSANAVFFDKPIGAVRDPGSVKVKAVDITFANGTYIEVGKSAAESVHIVATGTLVLPMGFVVHAAFNGGDYDGVANTFLPRPAPGVPDTALVELPTDRPIFSSDQNSDQTATGTIELTIGNTGERGLRVFVDWGDTVSQENRFEGPGGWADGDGLGDNNDPGDLFAIEGGSTISLTHTYTEEEVKAQLTVDNTFDVKYAVFQHEAIVIEAARVEQGAESLGTPGGAMTVLTTTMEFGPADLRFVPPLPGSIPDLANGTAAIQIAPPSGAVPFDFEVERPAVAAAPNNDAPPLDPLVTFQQVTKDDSASSSPVVGREQRFVLRLLSPDPTAPPLAEVDLPPDSFRADRLQRLFKELPDGAYEIDLLLGENTERPILRFDIRQGRPVVPQESLDGGQLRLEDIEETLKKNAQPSTSAVEKASGDVTSVDSQSEESAQPDSEATVGDENSSLEVRPAVTMSTLLEWKLRRRDAVREGSLTLASRLARRVCS